MATNSFEAPRSNGRAEDAPGVVVRGDGIVGCAAALALNSVIGFEPEWMVEAQITVGKVRRAVL